MMNSVFKCLMSAVCAVALPAFGQEEKTGFPTDRAVTVFSAGEGNPYASIRIPALLSIGKGQLLAFAEGRYKAYIQHILVYRYFSRKGRYSLYL